VDLFVIGAGSGGVRAARMAAQRGARVTVAEDGALGGTCVNLGCIPKKLYSFAAEYGAAFEQSRGYGWAGPAPLFDWATLKANRAREIGRLNGIYERLLLDAGVTLLRGRARLVEAGVVEVDGTRHRARHVLVATGAHPAWPELPGREHAVSSDAMFDLAEFPRRLVVVGAGYIACEFASIFHGLGAQVVQLVRGEQVLRGVCGWPTAARWRPTRCWWPPAACRTPPGSAWSASASRSANVARYPSTSTSRPACPACTRWAT
jgi:glutathione reductase (NADPH)